MAKRPLCLYIDDELIQLGKAKRINLSNFFENLLEAELELGNLDALEDDQDLILKLKSRNAILASQLKIKTDETIQLESKVHKLRLENEEIFDKLRRLKNERKQESSVRDIPLGSE